MDGEARLHLRDCTSQQNVFFNFKIDVDFCKTGNRNDVLILYFTGFADFRSNESSFKKSVKQFIETPDMGDKNVYLTNVLQ